MLPEQQQQPEDVEGATAEGLSTRAIGDPSNVVVDVQHHHHHGK